MKINVMVLFNYFIFNFFLIIIFLGRLFRRSIERMQPEIAHVSMNLHLQQLLVSSGDDLSQSMRSKQKTILVFVY